MSPIYEDDFEDIEGYSTKKPRPTTAGTKQRKIPYVKEFVLGGKTPEERRQLANILPVMQE